MKINKDLFLILFNNCHLVKGVKRSSIYDFQLGELHFIPNDLFSILQIFNGKRIGAIYENYEHKDHEIIDEYLSFLIEKNLVFIGSSDDIQLLHIPFPNKTDFLNEVSNAVVYITTITQKYLQKILHELTEERISAIHFVVDRSFNSQILTQLEEFLKADNPFLHHVEISMRFEHDVDYHKISMKYFKIQRLFLYDAFENSKEVTKNGTILVKSDQFDISPLHCGVNSPEYFSFNQQFYMESQKHNSCLNGKISIDEKGQIKNCPSMQSSFGFIGEITLSEALNKSGFKKFWDISKDSISICKDCEFRYICTDCRAFIEEPHNELSKPLKCGYDPKTGQWEKWSENPLKQKAIDFYGMRELIKS